MRKVLLKMKQCKSAPKCSRLEFTENQLQNMRELENVIKDVSERVEMMRKVLEDFIDRCQGLE